MKIAAIILLSLASTLTHAENAVTNIHVSARVNAYVRASNTSLTPTIETNSKADVCTAQNKDGYTVIYC